MRCESAGLKRFEGRWVRRRKMDEKSEVRLVWSSDFLMRYQSAVNSSVVTCRMGGVMTGSDGG